MRHTEAQLREFIEQSAVEIKGAGLKSIDYNRKLVSEYRFESLDVIDFFFEIQKRSKIEIDLSEIAIQIGATEGRRFNDITFQEVLTYLLVHNK